MKLYWGPHTCAIGTHVLLEEIGEPCETEKLAAAGGDTQLLAYCQYRSLRLRNRLRL